MKRVAWNFEISKDFNTLSEENQILQLAENLAFGIYYQIGQMQ